MPLACVGLGANLGDTVDTLTAAAQALARLPHTDWVAGSWLYRTRPVQATGPDYHNAVALLDTALQPEQLLDALQAIEAAHGRERPYRNAPRTLDLDLLCYGDQVVHTERLTLPHPRMLDRAFVLCPLLDVRPDFCAPGVPSMAERARALGDAQGVERLVVRLQYEEAR